VGTLNPFRYRGYYYNTETGLFYVASRYYDPNVGRFLNADSIVSTSGDLLGTNVFAYCGNNPVNRIDPDGHAWWHILIGVVCVVAIVAIVVVSVVTLQPELDLADGPLALLAEEDFAAAAEEAAPVVEETGQNIVKSPAVQQGLGKLADVAAKGKAGEAMSGLEKNTTRIPALVSNAAYRIPDGLDIEQNILSEVKNYSGTLSYTRQLQDFVAFTQANSGWQMHLYTNANLSGSLQALVNGGTIKLFPLG